MTTGQRLREIRAKYGISRSGLAKKAGVSLSFLNAIEKDEKEPTIATLRKICASLGITLGDFFIEGNEPVVVPQHLRPLLEEAKSLTPGQAARLRDFLAALKEKEWGREDG